MKTLNIITLGIITSALLLVGCSESKNVKPTSKISDTLSSISEDELGLRKSSVSDESNVVSNKTEYSKIDAGSGYKFKRAFQDAPPMIPHNIEGMLPITFQDNQCISCHSPEVALDMGATPIPASHHTNFRPQHKLLAGEKFVKITDDMKNEVSIKKQDTLVGARFNCVQCHAPQSQGELVKNNFEPHYVKTDGADKSSWKDERMLKGLETLGDDSFITEDDFENSDSQAGTLNKEGNH